MKPDYQVRIRRQTTPSGIPPVIMVTGIKQEGKSPHIIDERPDKSVKLIVLDLRGKMNNYTSNESSTSTKKLPKDMLQNILQSIANVQPNQPTDCPILATPQNTINIYTNINPKPQQPQQQQQQPNLLQQLQQMQFLPQNPMMANNMLYPGLYNNAFNNMMMPPPPPPPTSPLVFNQPNYFMASMANAGPNYNNMLYNNMVNPHQHMISPIPQQMLSPQQQHNQLLQQQQQQQQMQMQQMQQQGTANQNQIKRKPVQLQPTSYLSPQIEQRLQRKKSTTQQQQQQQYLQPQKQPPPPRSQTQQVSPKVAPKKKVTFHPEVQEFEYFIESEEEEPEEMGHDEQEYMEPYYPEQYEDEQVEEEEEDPYYTQPSYNYHHHHHPARKYRHYNNTSNLNYQQRQPPYYEENEAEEDYGELWKRRNYITRHHSKYKSRV